jgi:hypothetical protein
MTDETRHIIERLERLEAAQRNSQQHQHHRQQYDDDEIERLPTVKVAARYGVSMRSIERWVSDPEIGFPPPTVFIRGRKYWNLDVLEQYDRQAALTVGRRRPRGRPAHWRRETASSAA